MSNEATRTAPRIRAPKPIGPSVHSPWMQAAWVIVILAIVVSVLYPLCRIIGVAFISPSTGGFDLSGITSVLTEGYTWKATWNTLSVGLLATGAATLFAAPIAWGVVRTNMWGRRLIMHLAFLSFLTPGMLIALAYLIPLGPNMPLADWLSAITGTPVSLYSYWGLVFVTACHEFPIIFISFASALTNLPSDVEEAGYSHGLSPLTVVTKITLPLLRAPLLSAAFLGFVAGINIFGVQAVIAIPGRIPLLTTAIYQDFGYPVDFTHAATMALILLVISVALTLITNSYVKRKTYPLVGGKSGGFSRLTLSTPVNLALVTLSTIALGLMIVIPAITLLLGSLSDTGSYAIDLGSLTFSGYARLFELGQTTESIANSALFALISTLLVLAIAFLLVYFERHGFRFAKFFNTASDLAFVIPGIVLAFGLIHAYSQPPLKLYNTPAILIVAYVGLFLAFGRRNIFSGVSDIDRDLEHAAWSHSVPAGRSMFRVMLPLTRGSLVAAGIICFFFAFNELSASILLITSKTAVTATVLLSYKEEGLISQMYAFSTVLFFLSVAAYLVVMRFAGKQAFADID